MFLERHEGHTVSLEPEHFSLGLSWKPVRKVYAMGVGWIFRHLNLAVCLIRSQSSIKPHIGGAFPSTLSTTTKQIELYIITYTTYCNEYK